MASTNDRFYSQKIKTFFMRFDIDKNGQIEIEDFEKWAAKLAKIGNLNAQRAADLTKSLMAIWDVYFEPADTNRDGSVEIPELVVYMRNSVNSAQKRASIEATLPLIFDAIDTNGDGGIAVAEFTAYFQSLGINDAKVSSEVFNSMDLNGDGELSREEFSSFGTEFFIGQNANSPSKFFFGPLL